MFHSILKRELCAQQFILVYMYSETHLNQTLLGPKPVHGLS